MAIQTIKTNNPVQCVDDKLGRDGLVVYDDMTYPVVHHQYTTGVFAADTTGPGSRPMDNSSVRAQLEIIQMDMDSSETHSLDMFSDYLRGKMVKKMCLLICLLIIWFHIFFSYN